MRGSCLCGQVVFQLHGSLRPAIACHCEQCRKQTGNFWVASSVAEEGLELVRDDGLAWFNASPHAKRGFCKTCGSFLFWKPERAARYAVAVGALDEPHDLRLSRHIYVEEKAAFYDIADGLPQHAQLSGVGDD